MVLHHFGDSTLSDVKEVEKECVAAGAKTVVVAGDIAKPETAKDVSLVSSFCKWSRGKWRHNRVTGYSQSSYHPILCTAMYHWVIQIASPHLSPKSS